MYLLCDNEDFELNYKEVIRKLLKKLLFVWFLTFLLSVLILWTYTTIELLDQQENLRSRSLSCALESFDGPGHSVNSKPILEIINRYYYNGSNTKTDQKIYFETGPVYQLL